ncbi:unnamed protein product, partial [Callosobruchus maculatus]
HIIASVNMSEECKHSRRHNGR